jgi:hypothetical protein
LYKDGYLIGWDAQHEATRKALAEATDCINEQLYVIRQLEWLTTEQSREIAVLQRRVLADYELVDRLRLQRALLGSAVCWVVAWLVAWWLLG